MNGAYLGKLRERLGNIVGNAVAGKLEEKYRGRIPDAHVLHRDACGALVPAPLEGEFKSNQTYLQVVVNHMYVAQERKLWVEREHLGAVWMGFRYAGAMQSVPFVVGRELLVDKVQKLPPGARIEFQDVRNGRVYPYSGEGLALYLGLWSTPTVDWATTVFSALDTIAGKIKVAASLSQVLDMVDVLNQGISTILGLQAIQAHLNLYQEFQDPSAGDTGVLRPGHFVILNAPAADFDASALRVVDGRLCTARGTGEPGPYDERDFVLYSIVCLQQLPTAIDMFSKQYEAVLTALIGSKADANRLAQAAQEYHTLQTQVVTSPDLTHSDKVRLIAYFTDILNSDAIGLAVNLKSAKVAFAPGAKPRFPSGVQRPTQAGFEAHSARLADQPLTQNPTVAAGVASSRFSAARLGILQQESTGACAQRFVDVFVKLERGQDDHPHGYQTSFCGDLPRGPDAVQHRHAHIHEHDIRL